MVNVRFFKKKKTGPKTLQLLMWIVFFGSFKYLHDTGIYHEVRI